jgi:hypothetical protein
MEYKMFKGRSAYKPHQRGYSTFRRPKTWGLSGRKWDSIIRMVCMGCGRSLSRYEVYNELAWCFDCRKFIFPETVGYKNAGGGKSPHF